MIFSYSLILMSNPSRRLPVDYERKHSSKFVLEVLLNVSTRYYFWSKKYFQKGVFPRYSNNEYTCLILQLRAMQNKRAKHVSVIRVILQKPLSTRETSFQVELSTRRCNSLTLCKTRQIENALCKRRNFTNLAHDVAIFRYRRMSTGR